MSRSEYPISTWRRYLLTSGNSSGSLPAASGSAVFKGRQNGDETGRENGEIIDGE